MIDLSRIPTEELAAELERRNPLLPEITYKISRVMAIVALQFGISKPRMVGLRKTHPVCIARYAAWLILEDAGIKRRHIAQAFGRINVGTIRHGVIRGRELIGTSPAFARSVGSALAQFRQEK